MSVSYNYGQYIITTIIIIIIMVLAIANSGLVDRGWGWKTTNIRMRKSKLILGIKT